MNLHHLLKENNELLNDLAGATHRIKKLEKENLELKEQIKFYQSTNNYIIDKKTFYDVVEANAQERFEK